tara:strand:+ start:1108 stop:1335 length:228 start_codon:yes stop_codon:yes gene_type:complete
MLKQKLSVKKHKQSDQVNKLMESVEAGDLARLNLLIPENVKHDFNLACLGRKVKMTPVLVELMKQYIEESKTLTK